MTSFTKGRRITREQLDESRSAWDAGDFSDEWKPWRHLAAMEAGIILPPAGDAYDSWSDDQPSERALLIRAIRETPAALRAAIRAPGVHAWSNVIAILTRGRDTVSERIDQDDRDDARRRSGEATPRQATRALRDILDVIGGS